MPICMSFCVSKAVRPVNTMTPMTLIVMSRALLPMNMFTIMASRMPQSPISAAQPPIRRTIGSVYVFI